MRKLIVVLGLGLLASLTIAPSVNVDAAANTVSLFANGGEGDNGGAHGATSVEEKVGVKPDGTTSSMVYLSK